MDIEIKIRKKNGLFWPRSSQIADLFKTAEEYNCMLF